MKNNPFKYSIVITILFTCAFLSLTPACKKSPDKDTTAQSSSAKAVPVVLSPAVVRDFQQRLEVQGNLQALNFAVVGPRIPGPIERIFVDEGDEVTADKTKLFEIDSLKLARELTIKEHDVEVARYSHLESQTNLEKVHADFEKAELDYNRFRRLFEQQAVTADAFEQQQLRYKQTSAMQKHAQSLVDLTAQQFKKAQATLEIAQKDFADSTVYAPITGKVSMRFREPGETAMPGEPIIRIDDTSVIEASAYLPAEYYPQITQDQTKVKIVVSGIDLGLLPVSYKSPTIDSALRTFEIKCIVKAPPAGVVPGAIAEMAVIIKQRQGLAVPALAIQRRAGQDVVFIVENNMAHAVTISTGIESDGWLEILTGKITEHDLVVTMGQDMLDDGQKVSPRQEAR